MNTVAIWSTMGMYVVLADFNSQPRKEVDIQRLAGIHVFYISTHSLTGRLTVRCRTPGQFHGISTHSPARGLTFCKVRRAGCRGISTHSPARGLTRSLMIYNVVGIISTHSPARGLTDRKFTIIPCPIFQLTAPQGG